MAHLLIDKEKQLTGSGTAGLERSRSRRLWKILLLIFAVVAFIALSPWLWRQVVRTIYERDVKTLDSVQTADVAIVFGAAVYGDGRLSSVLRDRMDTAIALYDAGKVGTLLLSGDNSLEHYNEPGAMMAYAIRNGVAEEDIQPDFAGLRTYDTCYRARHIFQLDNAILVTQEFHLARALFTCQQLGIDAVGLKADLRPYRAQRWYELREIMATARALWDVLRLEPAQILGEVIPIRQ